MTNMIASKMLYHLEKDILKVEREKYEIVKHCEKTCLLVLFILFDPP
jgi:hypothetical protein